MSGHRECEGIAHPNNFLDSERQDDPEVTTATNECADTIGELYAYSATGNNQLPDSDSG